MEWAAKLAGIPDEVVALIVKARDKEAKDAMAMDVERQQGLMGGVGDGMGDAGAGGPSKDGGTPGSPSDTSLNGKKTERPPGLVQ
jgi:hypothetical protein